MIRQDELKSEEACEDGYDIEQEKIGHDAENRPHLYLSKAVSIGRTRTAQTVHF